MRWYLSRSEVAEGPFEEHDIVQMIRAGQVPPHAHVGAEGGAAWQPLASHPPFASASAPQAAPPAQLASSPSARPSENARSLGVSAGEVAALDLAQIPEDVRRNVQLYGRYERTAPRETMYAEIIALEAWIRQLRAAAERRRQRRGLVVLAGIPVGLLCGLLFHAIERGGFLIGAPLGFGAVAAIALALRSNVKLPTLSSSRIKEVIFPLLAKLELAPGSSVTIAPNGTGERMNVHVTLVSGVQARLSRASTSTSFRSGRYRHSTYTADDRIFLAFAAGRFPHVEAIGAVIEKQLVGVAGARAKVRATPTELSVSLPVTVKPAERAPHESMPPLVELMHKMLDPKTRVIDPTSEVPVSGPTALPCHVRMSGESAAELGDPVAMTTPLRVPEPPRPAAAAIDFDALCSAAHPGGGTGPRASRDALWRALLGLDRWYFAVSQARPTEPVMVRLEGKAWVFAFTDAARVARFCAENSSAVGGAHSLSIAMPVGGAREWLRAVGDRGVFGVHFNYGQPGWFAPIANVDRIHAHLCGPPRE